MDVAKAGSRGGVGTGRGFFPVALSIHAHTGDQVQARRPQENDLEFILTPLSQADEHQKVSRAGLKTGSGENRYVAKRS